MTKAVSSFESKENGTAISYGNGITVNTPSFSIALDPRSASESNYAFVSHAHIEHVHVPNGKSKIIASQETKELAKMRGYNLGKSDCEVSGIETIDSGHILGSRDRAFLKGFKGVKCETLIIESTYGRGHYVFPG